MDTSMSDILEILRKKAREDAAIFFDEFGEALDPESTDWDAVAFQTTFEGLPQETKYALQECKECYALAWDFYSDELVAETRRLAEAG